MVWDNNITVLKLPEVTLEILILWKYQNFGNIKNIKTWEISRIGRYQDGSQGFPAGWQCFSRWKSGHCAGQNYYGGCYHL